MLTKYAASLLLPLLALGGGSQSFADDAKISLVDAKDPRVALLKKLPPGSSIDSLKPAPIPGLYEFTEGTEVSYLTADGKFFLDGSIYDMQTRANLTEMRRVQARMAMMNAVPESEMIVFSPKATKYTITVFTDVDCAYCRKLHGDIAELNQMGVRVRYVAFPRSGPNTESWHKAEAVWCSADRNEALTRAKNGGRLDLSKTCNTSPVKREYELGRSLGVRGTPAILTEQGDYISGYLPPSELVQNLKELKLAKR